MKRIDDFIDFFLHEKGETVQINGASCAALLCATASGSAYYTDDRIIRTKQAIATGDVVTWQEKAWLIISQVTKETHSYKAKMRQCNHETKFILDDWLYSFETILDVGTFGVSEGEIISIVDGRLNCTLRQNALSDMITLNQRFIASKSAWEITGIDRTHTGLLTLYGERDVFVDGDDRENEIANADTLPDWHIVMSEETFSVTQGATHQLTADLYKGTAIEEATLQWHSSDESIATVSADGLVTGIALGTVTITATWTKHPSITASSDGEVEEHAPDIITYRFYSMYVDGTGKSYTDFGVIDGSTRVMGIEKYLNGVLTTNDTYTFTLTPNGASASHYDYTVIDGASVSIHCRNYDPNAMTLSGVSNQSGTSLQVSVTLNGFM